MPRRPCHRVKRFRGNDVDGGVDIGGDRDDVVIDDLALHRRHAESDDRIGHMDVMVG
jgi:hypothetical protein